MTDFDFEENPLLVPIHKIDKILLKTPMTKEEKRNYERVMIQCDDPIEIVIQKQRIITRFIQKKLN